ncbi:zinc metalloproteinase/disintegrin-like [Belonocnema kinseyi]|uniref:zinc metalloproteinase/disintegrin-like n=1 Tax=Belonocnema kinseyi TaxID=2817044 RepID=UPI00143DC06D|nr:zinc metalloproteinase/disintegrin-like [Belonocnema kinseyi]
MLQTGELASARSRMKHTSRPGPGRDSRSVPDQSHYNPFLNFANEDLFKVNPKLMNVPLVSTTTSIFGIFNTVRGRPDAGWANPGYITWSGTGWALAFEDIGIFYEDPEYLASFALTKEDDDGMNKLDKTLLLDGVFTINGNNMVLRSLPKRHRSKRKIQQLDFLSSEEDNSHMIATVDHAVFHIRESPHLNRSSISANSFLKKLDKLEITKKSNRKIPDVIYPEILLILDQNYYSHFEQNFAKALSYIVTLFNGVDLMFRALSKPEVRLNIAGIILSEDQIPVFHTFLSGKNNILDGDGSLEEIGKYLFKEKRFSFKKDYDLALLMTGYDMFHDDGKQALGLAFLNAACTQASDKRKIWALGLVQDDFAFWGILIAAHELAHLFGADHDAEHCEYGHVMTGNGHAAGMENLYQFSSCSQKAMRDFFKTNDAGCLFNKPPEDNPVPVILPGQYMSLHEQCIKRGFDEPINYDETVCTKLCCAPQVDDVCGLPAAQGSPCGFDMCHLEEIQKRFDLFAALLRWKLSIQIDGELLLATLRFRIVRKRTCFKEMWIHRIHNTPGIHGIEESAKFKEYTESKGFKEL